MNNYEKAHADGYEEGYEAGYKYCHESLREHFIAAIQEKIDVNMPFGMQAGLARAIKVVKELKT